MHGLLIFFITWHFTFNALDSKHSQFNSVLFVLLLTVDFDAKQFFGKDTFCLNFEFGRKKHIKPTCFFIYF